MSHETRQSTTSELRGVNRDDRTVDLVISTYDIDSHGTRIDQSGWDFESFKKNPVICLQHDDRGYTGSNGLPIANGIPETIRVEGGKTYMRIRFPEKGKFPLADQVFDLVADGFMRGVSVGFDPQEHEEIEEEIDGYRKSVFVYRKQKLLEVSLVTIPSNDNALVQRAANLNADVNVIRRMTEQMEQSLETQVQPKPEEVELWRAYFHEKKPANKAATKVLKAFYDRILKESPPENEVEAWERMGGAVDAMNEAAPEVEGETKEEEKQEEVQVEEPTEPITPPAETPQEARKTFVQISLSALPALCKSVRDTCVEAAVKASQQGIPQSEWNGVIDATGSRFQEAFFPTPTK